MFNIYIAQRQIPPHSSQCKQKSSFLTGGTDLFDLTIDKCGDKSKQTADIMFLSKD